MDEMSSFWGYQENTEELKQKLLYTTLQLEQVKAERSEEMRKIKENTMQLVQLLKVAYKERDEARDQLQKLVNKVMPSSTPAEFFTTPPQVQADSPLLKPTKANSSITESNSLSEAYNYHSHGSSPVDSLFDAVSSPELSNINVGDSSAIAFMNQPMIQECNGALSGNLVSPSPRVPKIDHGSLIIDNLVKGKSLPPKGKLLQAVLDAGPLLQTLLVAGPLPRWRNPPQLQPFTIPPVSIKGCDAVTHVVPRSMNSQPYAEMSCATSQMLSGSLFHLNNGPHGAPLGSDRLIPAFANSNSYVTLGKRQRFH